VVKRGLNQPPLALVQSSIAGEESLAEKRTLKPKGHPEALRVDDQHVAYHVWVGQQVDLLTPQPKAHGVAMGALGLLKKGKWVASKF
jgi:hypothetical protein